MEIPRHWRLKRERIAFELGHRCGMCGAVFTQDRPVCLTCGLQFESGKFVGEVGERWVDYFFRIFVATAEQSLLEGDKAAEEMMAIAVMQDTDKAIDYMAALV